MSSPRRGADLPTSSATSRLVAASSPSPSRASPSPQGHEKVHQLQSLDWQEYLTEKRKILFQAVAGEGLVTLLFMFIVCAFHVNTVRANHVDEQGLIIGAMGTAFASIALIYSFADVSGAHFNAAVTFATVVTGKTSIGKGCAYIGVQIFGSLCAMALLQLCYPNSDLSDLLTVAPDSGASLINVFFMEFVLTFILVYVIFAVAFDTVDTKPVIVQGGEETETAPLNANKDAPSGSGNATKQQSLQKNLTIYTTTGNTKAGFAPISIGFTLGFLCMIGGTVSGGAFNPTRVLAPALIGGDFSLVWLYWIADCLGAGAAGLVQQRFFARTAAQNKS